MLEPPTLCWFKIVLVVQRVVHCWFLDKTTITSFNTSLHRNKFYFTTNIHERTQNSNNYATLRNLYHFRTLVVLLVSFWSTISITLCFISFFNYDTFNTTRNIYCFSQNSSSSRFHDVILIKRYLHYHPCLSNGGVSISSL